MQKGVGLKEIIKVSGGEEVEGFKRKLGDFEIKPIFGEVLGRMDGKAAMNPGCWFGWGGGDGGGSERSVRMQAGMHCCN